MFRLPVSRLEVTVRAPNGGDDLAILESRGSTVDKALTVLSRLMRASGQNSASDSDSDALWLDLTVTDFEYALLALRQRLFGDTLACVFSCSANGCGERMELDFSIAQFLQAVTPKTPKAVAAAEARPGWFVLSGSDATFRLPTTADQYAVLGQPHAETMLAARLIDSRKLDARKRNRIERAMSTLAPEVSRTVSGRCASCAAELSIPVYVPQLVVEEMRRSAAGVHDEIHAIAHGYHWTEDVILAMPRTRRQAYAERIRSHSREVN
jgi:hypothetical protein